MDPEAVAARTRDIELGIAARADLQDDLAAGRILLACQGQQRPEMARMYRCSVSAAASVTGDACVSTRML